MLLGEDLFLDYVLHFFGNPRFFDDDLTDCYRLAHAILQNVGPTILGEEGIELLAVSVRIAAGTDLRPTRIGLAAELRGPPVFVIDAAKLFVFLDRVQELFGKLL